MLLSFHNNQEVKNKYMNRVKAHAIADEIIKGVYWERGKGCAVGCTIHSAQHNAYEAELGLPEWLAILEDRLFEGLSLTEAKKFPLRFLSAIPIGINLDSVKGKFCAFLLKDNSKRVRLLDIGDKLKEQVVQSIGQVLAVHEKAIAGQGWDESAAWSAAKSAESAWSAAKSAAWSAAKSAESAWSAAGSAWSAAKSAESAAWSAACAAESAAWSAESAACSAESAAWSAESAWSAAKSAESAACSAESACSDAKSATYEKYADELIRLLSEATTEPSL